jgi:nicotinamide phosphoribosyltransferase
MGGKEDELETIRRVIQDVYPVGIVSVVCDTWNYWDTITVILPKLKDVIMNRGKDALGFCKTVIRPDSGDPVRIICGYADAEVVRVSYAEERAFRVIETGELISEREFKGSIQLLGEIFGYTRNDAGYYDLNEHIGLIYGDSITLDKARDILERLMAKGYSANNVVLGVGSYSYQHVTRDTHGFAFKATSGIVNGERRELFKDPATDDGTKKSAAGLIRVMKDINGEYYQQDRCTEEEEQTGDLTDLFIDGSLCKFVTLADARNTLGVF